MNVCFLKNTWWSGTIDSQSQKEGLRSSGTFVKCFQERINEFVAEKKKKKELQIEDNNSREIIVKNPTQDITGQINLREKMIFLNMEPMSNFKYDIMEMEFSEFGGKKLSVFDVFCVLFHDNIIYKNGEEFYKYLKVELFKDVNYSATQFKPPIPQLVSNELRHVRRRSSNLSIKSLASLNNSSSNNEQYSLLKFIQSTQMSEREVRFTHSLPSTSIPFMPKVCQVREVIRVHCISPSMIVINTEVFTQGVPKCECFIVRIRYILTQDLSDPSRVSLSWKTYVHFTQKTIISSQIEKNSIQQQRVSSQIIQKAFQEAVSDFIIKRNDKQSLVPLVCLENSNGKDNLSEQKNHLSIRQQSMRENQNYAIQQELNNDKQNSVDLKLTKEPSFVDLNRARLRRIEDMMESDDKYQHLLLEKVITRVEKGVNMFEVIKVLFSDKRVYKGCSSFWEYLKQQKYGDSNIIIGKYSSPQFPHESRDLIKLSDFTEREISFIHPLPSSHIPFMPKTCKVREVMRIYWLSSERVVVDCEIFTSGIPKADSFTVHFRQVFSVLETTALHLKLLTYVNFKERSLFSGQIESQSISQQKQAAEKILLPAYSEVLETLLKPQDIPFQTQYSLKRVKSIHIVDDPLEEENKDETYENYNDNFERSSPKLTCLKKQMSNQIYYRSSLSKQNTNNQSYINQIPDKSHPQITELANNLTKMNDRFKYLAITFLFIYISSIIFLYFLNK